MGYLELRVRKLERRLRLVSGLAIGMISVMLLFVLTAAVQLDDEVRLTKGEYLTLMIKDRLDWQVGLWADRVHTKVWLNTSGDRNTISVTVDHPNGVDLSKYAGSYVLLEDAGKSAAEAVLEGRGWQDDFEVSSFYASKPQ